MRSLSISEDEGSVEKLAMLFKIHMSMLSNFDSDSVTHSKRKREEVWDQMLLEFALLRKSIPHFDQLSYASLVELAGIASAMLTETIFNVTDLLHMGLAAFTAHIIYSAIYFIVQNPLVVVDTRPFVTLLRQFFLEQLEGEHGVDCIAFHVLGGILPACSASFLMFGNEKFSKKLRDLASSARSGFLAPLQVSALEDRILLATLAVVDDRPASYLSLLCALLDKREAVDIAFIAAMSVIGHFVYEKTKSSCFRETTNILENKKAPVFQDSVFSDEEFKDVVLNVHAAPTGDVASIAAHRLVLAHNSEFFRTLFNSSFADSASREVTIKDVDLPLFRQFVNFCYGTTALGSPQNALDLLRLAGRFLCSELKTLCAWYLLCTDIDNSILFELWEVVNDISEDEQMKIQCEMALADYVFTNLGAWGGENGVRMLAQHGLLDMLSRGLAHISSL